MKYLFPILILLFCCLSAQAQTEDKKRGFDDYVKERSFQLNAAAAVTEFVVAVTLIDGHKVQEAHPWFASDDGKMLKKRAITAKLATVFGPYLIYRWNKRLGRLVLYAGAIAQGASAAVTVGYRF